MRMTRILPGLVLLTALLLLAATAYGLQIPQVPHPSEGREDCLLCHDPEGQVMPAPSDHADYANEQCTICHKAVP